MIYRWVSSHRSMTMNHFIFSSFRSFETFFLHFLLECFHPKSTILWRVSSRINGRYVLRPLGLQNFSNQRKLSHISPQECPVSELHNLSPRGEILEVDTWTNQAGAMCHVLTNFSLLQMHKTYWHMAHIPGDVRNPCHFRNSRIHITSRWRHCTPSLRLFRLRDFESFHTSTLPIIPNSEFPNWPIFHHVSS